MTHWQFANALPSDIRGGWYAHYDHLLLNEAGWQACDIRAVMRAHQEEWLDAFDEWHAELCHVGIRCSRWWWCLAASRPNVWILQPSLKPLLYAAAVREWRQAHPECEVIYLIGCPKEVQWYLREFAQPLRSVRRRWMLLLRRWRALWAAFREIRGRFGRHVLSYCRRRPRVPQAGILFYSHVVQAEALRRTGDHFFGTEIIAAVEAARPGGVLVGYVLHEEADREPASRTLHAGQSPFTFLLDQLTWGDALWVSAVSCWTCLSLRRLRRCMPTIRIGTCASRLFGQLYVADHALRRPAGLELGIYRAMRRLLAQCGAHTLVYPYEEKALERAILQACAEQAMPVRTLAFAHPAHSTCHIALRTRLGDRPNPPSPDVILATGPRARDFLVQWARKPDDAVVAIGSPRHESPPDEHSLERRHASRTGLRMLVLAGYGHELPMLAEFLRRGIALQPDDEVLVRPYSFGWSAAQEQGLQRLVKHSPRIRVGTEPLHEQLRWCDLALFSSTTAGVQAMLGRCLVAHIDLQDIAVTDPLMGEPACFARCATPAQLAEALTRARTLGEDEYAACIHRQQTFAASILAPIDRANLIEHVLQDAVSREPVVSAARHDAVVALTHG